MAKWWRALVMVGLLSPTAAASAAGQPPAARAFVEALLARVAVPPGAMPAASVSANVGASTGEAPGGVTGLVVVRHDYTLSASVNIGAFITYHWLQGSSQESWGTGSGPGWMVSNDSAVLSCANRHVVDCGYFYNYGMVGGRQELQVGAYATWGPIEIVTMPTTGVATLTGFARTSFMNRSSHPASTTLTGPQRAAIATAIAGLKDSLVGMCMEDSELYTLTVRSSANGAVLWRASADVCPGVLSITWPHHHAALDARSCALDRALVAALPSAATATRRALASCL